MYLAKHVEYGAVRQQEKKMSTDKIHDAVKEDKQRFGVPEEDAMVDGSRGSIVVTTKGSSSKKMTQLSNGPKESLAFIDVHHDSQQVFYCLLRILMVSFPVGEF